MNNISLVDLGATIVAALARVEAGIIAVREDKIAAGKALLVAKGLVYAMAGNQPPAAQAARWTVWLADLNIGAATARQCMKLAAAPDPEQALSEARERAAARKARRILDDERGLPATLMDLLRELQDTLDADSFDDALQWAVTAARQSRGRRAA